MAKTPHNKKTAAHPKHSWRAVLLGVAKRLADSPLPASALIATFILARWWNNSDFSYPDELLVPIALFAVLTSLVFYGYRWVLGVGLPPLAATIILTWCLYSYGHLVETKPGSWLAELLPNGWETDLSESLFVAVVVAMFAGLTGWCIGWAIRRSDHFRRLQPYKVVLFALAFIFTVQLGRCALRLLEIGDQLSYRYPDINLAKPAQTASKPDIYYLVFDRYGNKEALANNFNFDNSNLYQFLGEKGFVNREDGFANYPFTMSSISSTLAMNYFPEFEERFADDGDWQSAFAYRDILNNPPIAKNLKKSGYTYNQVSSWWDFTRIGINADSQPTISFRLQVLGAKYYLSDLERDVLNKSALGPWLKKGFSAGDWPILKYDLNRNPSQNFEAQFSALKDSAARADKTIPQFSFAHVLVPHDPYIFTADGSTPQYDNNRTDNGVDEAVKYTNQVTYLNSRIKDLISFIREKSPDAVIVIQADEGPYPKEFRFKLKPGHYYDPVNLSDEKMKQKFSILASYYLPGINPDEPISSSVNTFRYILNRYLGYSLPMLPACHLSTGDKYTVYNYKEVTQRLTGQPAEVGCDQYDPQVD